MKRSLTLCFAFLFISWLVSCGSTKKSSATAINQKALSEKAITITEKINIVTNHIGDTLKGSVPLPELGKLPVRYQMSSSGTTLDLELTENNLTYKVTPKQVGKTSTNIDRSTKENSRDKVDAKMEDSNQSVNHPWRPPFLMYLMAIGLLIAAYYVFKNRLNPF